MSKTGRPPILHEILNVVPVEYRDLLAERLQEADYERGIDDYIEDDHEDMERTMGGALLDERTHSEDPSAVFPSSSSSSSSSSPSPTHAGNPALQPQPPRSPSPPPDVNRPLDPKPKPNPSAIPSAPSRPPPAHRHPPLRRPRYHPASRRLAGRRSGFPA